MISLLRSPVTRPVLARRIGTPPKPLRVASTLSQPRKLDLPALDRKWQAIWQQQEGAPQKSPNPVHQYQQQQPTASTPPQTTDTPRTYILSMFPYPSGTLHMGHLRVYTISDVLARFYRLRGHDVLHPMGWDAFGLPAENAAMERGVDPAVWTRGNIERMKAQLGRFSGCFDWDCELTTCEPEFYEHTQRIFLLLYRHGLAYRDEAVVNYDPVDGTVLANEQVDARGYSWRSGGRIQKLKLRQWFFRITAFKETLLNDLDSLTGGWPERVLSMQRNWLGRSEGAKVKFPVSVAGGAQHDAVSVFTTRPDTLYGVEYLALSLNHPIVRQAAEKDEQLRVFVEDAASLPGDSKVGYKLSDVWASHPLHIIDKESPHVARNLPVFAAPYVVGDYGEGAVMGVPGHDARDLVFFKQNANPDSIPMVVGAEPLEEGTDSGVVSAADAKAFTNEGYLTSRCWKYQGLHSREASKQIVTDLKMVAHGEAVEQWRLRDWLISRQRYWGTPIPIIHCDDCGAVPVPEDQLPVKLPPLNEEILKGRQGKKGNPLEWSEEWKRVECPSCGKPATRDTDTMDTFVDSSWYYLRFLDAKNKEQPFASGSARPVDVYIGGVEHAILHLLYARFIYKFLSQSELFPEIARMDPSQSQSQSPRPPAEPFKTLISQGMVHGKTYTDPTTGRIIPPEEIDASKPDQPVIKDTQTRPQVSFEKMSKSKHNGVDPTACTQRYGADAARAHVLFAAPVSEVLEWDESKIVGIERWYGRVWKVVHDVREQIASRGGTAAGGGGGGGGGGGEMALPAVQELSDDEAEAVLATQQTIESVTHSIEANVYGLNTVVSDLTKLTNTLAGASGLTVPVAYVCARALLGMLAPIAPALASEGWEVLHGGGGDGGGAAGAAGAASVPGMGWPRPLLSPDDAQTLRARGGQTVAVQVNGKLRFTVQIPRAASATTAGSTEASDSWVVNRVLETRAGVEWLRERNDWEKRRRVVVVKGGRVVNVVF